MKANKYRESVCLVQLKSIAKPSIQSLLTVLITANRIAKQWIDLFLPERGSSKRRHRRYFFCIYCHRNHSGRFPIAIDEWKQNTNICWYFLRGCHKSSFCLPIFVRHTYQPLTFVFGCHWQAIGGKNFWQMEGNFRSFSVACMFESKIKLSSASTSFGNLGEPFNHSPTSLCFIPKPLAWLMQQSVWRWFHQTARLLHSQSGLSPTAWTTLSLKTSINLRLRQSRISIRICWTLIVRTKLDDSLEKKIEISLTRMYPFLLNHLLWWRKRNLNEVLFCAGWQTSQNCSRMWLSQRRWWISRLLETQSKQKENR